VSRFSSFPFAKESDEDANDIEAPASDSKALRGVESRDSSSRVGCGMTSIPGLSANEPKMKSEFLGLMQYSSTLILLLVSTP